MASSQNSRKEKFDYLKKQSVFVESAPDIPGQTKPIRNIRFPDKLITHDPNKPGVTTLYNNLTNSVSKYPDNNAFGTREGNGPYKWVTYKQFLEIAHNFGFGLLNLGLKPKDKVGLYSKNRMEWEATEHAANSQSMPTVAIYDTFGPDVIEYIINHAELPVVVTSSDNTQKLLDLSSKCPTFKFLVQMEDLTDEQKKAAEGKSVKLVSFKEVVEDGKKNPQEVHPPMPEDLCVIMYTSGTTGPPKGVMHVHSGCIAAMAALEVGNSFKLFPTDVYISYLPLAHIFERMALAAVVGSGGAIGFYSGDVKKLSDDIQTLKPTVMCGVPRIFERIYTGINDQVQKGGFLKKFLFNYAVSNTQKNLSSKDLLFEEAEAKAGWLDKKVLGKVKLRLGGQVRQIASGAAPLAPATHLFMKAVFGCPVVQGYGLTETCAAGTVADVDDNELGHVGPPVVSTEIKLVDVEEMGYRTSGEDICGEIWIRGAPVAKGYYKDEKKTKEDFDDDGWFHTGDIGRLRPNGTLAIIDRKKNIFKLSHGEYVAAEKLELKYASSNFVNQIFVYGDSYTPFLIAIVHPEESHLKAWASEHKIKPDDKESLCKVPELRKAILDEFNHIHKVEKLNGVEQIKGVIVTPIEFTPANELVTPTMKLKRPALKKFFEENIIALYKELGVEIPQSTK